jgi:hypothetical protein
MLPEKAEGPRLSPSQDEVILSLRRACPERSRRDLARSGMHLADIPSRGQVYSAPRPPILIGAAMWDGKCNVAACWFIAVAAWVRRLPMTLLKSSVVTVCSHKEHLKVVPPFIDLVV